MENTAKLKGFDSKEGRAQNGRIRTSGLGKSK
jgi:hypothetical protein